MGIRFNQVVKQGRHTFFPGGVMAFEDERAEEYFVKVGWAEATDEAPGVTLPAGTLTHYDAEGNEVPGIDVAAIFGDGPSKGQSVLTES